MEKVEFSTKSRENHKTQEISLVRSMYVWGTPENFETHVVFLYLYLLKYEFWATEISKRQKSRLIKKFIQLLSHLPLRIYLCLRMNQENERQSAAQTAKGTREEPDISEFLFHFGKWMDPSYSPHTRRYETIHDTILTWKSTDSYIFQITIPPVNLSIQPGRLGETNQRFVTRTGELQIRSGCLYSHGAWTFRTLFKSTHSFILLLHFYEFGNFYETKAVIFIRLEVKRTDTGMIQVWKNKSFPEIK